MLLVAVDGLTQLRRSRSETGEPYSVCLYSATDGVEDVTFEVLVPTTSYCTCFACLVVAADHLLCLSFVLCALQRGQANTARLAVAHPARKLLLADFDVASGATAVRSEKKRTWGMLGGGAASCRRLTLTLTMAWPLPESWMGKMFERTYESYRVLATAADGTKIPITIAHRTDVSHDRRYACHTKRVSHPAHCGIVGYVCMALLPPFGSGTLACYRCMALMASLWRLPTRLHCDPCLHVAGCWPMPTFGATPCHNPALGVSTALCIGV